ncbi:MAG: hypothetical protein ABI457_10540 [Hyphomicrobium sp.]|jgi:hypothetical protein
MPQHRPPPQTLPGRCGPAEAVFALFVVGLAGCSGIGTQNGAAPLPADAPAPTATAAAGAPTIDAATRSTPVVPGRRARVFVFAGFGKKCEPVPAPQITITAPPAKGDITFEPGQETTIQYSAQGTCIGQRVQGTGVYYTARAGQNGTDRFALSAKLGTGETADRSFEVRIEE